MVLASTGFLQSGLFNIVQWNQTAIGLRSEVFEISRGERFEHFRYQLYHVSRGAV